jgi:hypothetical protein
VTSTESLQRASTEEILLAASIERVKLQKTIEAQKEAMTTDVMRPYRSDPIRVEVWRCDRCGNRESVEIYEAGDGVIGDWVCAEPHMIGQPLCGGMYRPLGSAFERR